MLSYFIGNMKQVLGCGSHRAQDRTGTWRVNSHYKICRSGSFTFLSVEAIRNQTCHSSIHSRAEDSRIATINVLANLLSVVR
jgi:hypothetical protein